MTTHELIAPRLAALRAHMADQELDALIIPHDDEHLGEYIPPEADRLSWLTGFTGSAGVVDDPSFLVNFVTGPAAVPPPQGVTVDDQRK